VMQSAIPVARIELLDAQAIRATNLYSKLDLAPLPTLFVEFHGTPAAVEADAARFHEIALAFGGSDTAFATRAEERSRLWQARHDAYWASRALRPGCDVLSTDVCVPISRLAECVTATADDIAALGLTTTIVGHVGDGNFHVLVLIDPASPAEHADTEVFLERLARRAIAMDGTSTGEHGVGQGKMAYLTEEHGEDTLDVMRQVKRAIDPRNIMNPGKIFALQV
jgi:D-lactate dehydrogenase (cytochrome)